LPLLPPPIGKKQRRGRRMAAAGERGKRTRAERGFDCPKYHGRRQHEEAARLRWAAASSGTRGGGVGGQGRS